MQNVTIAMDEGLIRLTEAEAAKAGKSLSDFISELVTQSVRVPSDAEARSAQIEAVERISRMPTLPLSENGRMPGSEERNAR